MSLNVSLTDIGPRLMRNERLLTSANGVEMRFNSGNGYPATSTKLYSKNGHLFLTNFRLVYVPRSPTPACESLECPLVGITDEKYKQPLLFGSNKLQGQVRVVPGSRIHGDVGSFSFTFKKGDSAEFYRDFLGALGSARFAVPNHREDHSLGDLLRSLFYSAMPHDGTGASSSSASSSALPATNVDLDGQAFFDPNDPSRIFIAEAPGERSSSHRPSSQSEGGGASKSSSNAAAGGLPEDFLR